MNTTSVGTSRSIYAALRSAVSNLPNRTAETNLKNTYFQSGINPFTENADKASVDVGNDYFYSELEARAVASAENIAEQKNKFADMYVISAAHKYFSDNQSKAASSLGLLNLRVEIAGIAREEECMPIPIEAGELPQLMDTIQNSLKNGMSLAEILKQKYDNHISKYGEEGHTNSFADWFSINTSTGEVMSADPISRTYHGDSFDEELSDVEAVMELADDLATFLKYAVFSQDSENPEKVNELFSFIKNKQDYANYDRFLAEDEEAADVILQSLIAAGVLKDDDEEKKEEAIDGLMEAIRIHQEELRENKIDMEESKKIIAEIQEIIDGAAFK